MASLSVKLDSPSGKSLRIRLKAEAKKMHNLAAALGDYEPAFKKLDKRLDKDIKKVFKRGWPDAPLSPETVNARDDRTGWYTQPGLHGDTGRWTDKMYRGLLGFRPRGSKRMTGTTYRRDYNTKSESFNGKNVARRVVWFHLGIPGRQPARRLFLEGERAKIAHEILETYVNQQIKKRFKKK